jgi:hypothetical protein
VIELFKVKSAMITSIEATFIAVPYNLRSPWTPRPSADARPARS